jgi:hypothetical protein
MYILQGFTSRSARLRPATDADSPKPNPNARVTHSTLLPSERVCSHYEQCLYGLALQQHIYLISEKPHGTLLLCSCSPHIAAGDHVSYQPVGPRVRNYHSATTQV